jgi:Uma2 family endonuclease
MTTTQAYAQAQPPQQPAELSDELTPAEWFRGYFLLPLSEFGQSLDNPELDVWLEGFAERNKDVVGDLEITARGELKIMAPTGMPGDRHEAEMTAELVFRAREHGGRAGGPTSLFILPDGSRLSPDAWWMSDERWNALSDEARTPPFAAVVPDFVAEIVSPSNRGPELEDKVRRYLEGGARLVWVINARRRQTTIHRPGAEPETLEDPETLDGGDVLPGLTFNVRERIFDNVP